MDNVYDALGGDVKAKPSYDLRENLGPIKSKYNYTPNMERNSYTTSVLGDAKVSDFNDAMLAHELAHSTSPIEKSRFSKVMNKLYALGQDPRVVALSPVVQQVGGKWGNAITAIPTIARLAEEGQANIRGAKALYKVNGKLTAGNLAGFGTSMGSYLGDAAAKHILGPWLSKKQTDFMRNALLKAVKR